MPKYILDTRGNLVDPDQLKDRKGNIIDHAQKVSKAQAGLGGSFYNKGDGISSGETVLGEEFFKTAAVNLPFFTDNDLADWLEIEGTSGDSLSAHAIRSTGNPEVDDNGFVKRDREKTSKNYLLNPSFGADKPQNFYNNFNDYLNKGEIFATELEMMSGTEFNSLGFRDITRFTFIFDYLLEVIVYIITIEAILLIDLQGNNKVSTEAAESFQLELGNYGPASYTSITRYFKEVLQYPMQDKRSTGPVDRLGGFFIGLAAFVNADDLTKFTSGLGKEWWLKERPNADSGKLLWDPLYYLADSLLSFSNVGNNRLLMLIRRFHQKGDWHTNRLYKAKEIGKTKENRLERYLAELNYYYVKFFIERMNVGLQHLTYYKNKNSRSRKFHRSARLKDSRNKLFNFKSETMKESTDLHYFAKNSDDLKLEMYETRNTLYKQRLDSRQSMSNALLPQAFIIPSSLTESNNAKIHSRYQSQERLCEDLVRGYFIQTEKTQKRISQKVVKQLEDHYEKEMMPFYFQDLRTNEILGFHAFIDSITDNFNVNHNPTKGFGRIEDIRHYVDTTRNVNITFTLAAMSKEDHDLMWYQINKIVSMCYPQWSKGFKNKDKDTVGLKGFEYPFTQVPTASPLIRIRLGDVLKSNYSKHSLKKIHGMGNGIQTSKQYNTNNVIIHRESEKEKGLIKQKKLKSQPYAKYILLPGIYRNKRTGEYREFSEQEIQNIGDVDPITGLGLAHKKDKTILRDKYDDKFFVVLSPEKSSVATFFLGKDEYEVDKKSLYITVQNWNKEREETGSDGRKHLLKEDYEEYVAAYRQVEGKKLLNNPITAAYESTLGRGLAGFITMLDVNYQDQLWETEVKGSKAPKLVKLTINFAPVHDIAPGLDADGAMRAPVYNTGRIVNSIYGDVYDNSTIDPKNEGYNKA